VLTKFGASATSECSSLMPASNLRRSSYGCGSTRSVRLWEIESGRESRLSPVENRPCLAWPRIWAIPPRLALSVFAIGGSIKVEKWALR
jgi:hypothetical protein